jgi:hypothetical protein
MLIASTSLLAVDPVLFVPVLEAVRGIVLEDLLLAFRPPHPIRFARGHQAHHLLGNGEGRIDRRRKWMHELGPMLIPEPEHCCLSARHLLVIRTTTLAAKRPLARTFLCILRPAILRRREFLNLVRPANLETAKVPA